MCVGQSLKMKFSAFIVTIAICVYHANAYPWIAAPKEEQWWMDRHAAYKANTEQNAANIHVLFYGDSITEGWAGPGRPTFDQYYAPLGTANYGIGGDQTQHLIWRIFNGEVEGLAPKVTVLKIGTNNLGGYTDNDIAAGTLAVLRSLRQKLPNTKILLLGVLPRNNAQLNQRVRNINTALATAENGNTVRYLDLFNVFCKGDDQFESHLYDPDLLHLSAAGYQAWAEAMAPLFNEMWQSD